MTHKQDPAWMGQAGDERKYLMSDSTTTSSGGVGFTGLLTIAFIVLKLCHVIDWPWLWVLAPLWIGFAIGLLICLVLLVIWLVVRNR